MIFDIGRFSLDDGPGIRTTLFFKGCPLRCLWCHNPESQQAYPEIDYLFEKCTGCGACVAVCEYEAHRLENGVHLFDRSICTRCGRCASACVYDVLRVTGKEYTVEELMREIMRDEAYYTTSDGGVTFSGGEPVMQLPFLVSILSACKERGLHTCVDTTACFPRSSFDEILNLVDLFLVDYKVCDSREHKRLTGKDNSLILKNIAYLVAQNAKVRIRCPLIPGINDNDEHLEAIAALSKRYPTLEGIQIMPYHDVGNQKYLRFGYENKLADVPMPSDEQKEAWLARLRSFGCDNVFI